jgi:hypothetical protein
MVCDDGATLLMKYLDPSIASAALRALSIPNPKV